MIDKIRREARLLPIVAVAFVIFGLVFGGNATLMEAGTYSIIFGIATMGLSLLLGNVAQISVGQAGFFAIGAYAVGYFTAVATWPHGTAPWVQYVLGTLAGVACATLLGLVVGFISLRFRGHYLAISTLTFNLIVVGVIHEVEPLGGANGISNVPFAQLGSFTISGTATYWYALAILTLVAAATWRILATRTGRAFEAIRNDELAAEASGVPTRRYKIFAFAYAGALAGLAGTLYVSYLGLIVPDAVSVTLSIDLLLMVILGGSGSITGALIGAALVGITNVYGHALGNWRPVIYGIAVVVIVIVLPNGLVGLVPAFWRRRRPAPSTARTSPPPAQLPAIPRAEEPWLAVDGVTKSFGGLVAVDRATFTLENGTLTSLIGPNGAGKTTLFNAICGIGKIDAGRVSICGRDVGGRQPHEIVALGVARSFQNARLFGEMTVLENVLTGAFSAPHYTLADARATLALLGIEHLAETLARELAFGDRRRVELARALAGSPQLLLLDEPAAGLNASERGRLSDDLRALRAAGMTILLIEHDMRLVMDISDRVMVLDFGKLIADGPPERVQNEPAVVAAYLGVAS